jgi:hypothetical protein
MKKMREDLHTDEELIFENMTAPAPVQQVYTNAEDRGGVWVKLAAPSVQHMFMPPVKWTGHQHQQVAPLVQHVRVPGNYWAGDQNHPSRIVYDDTGFVVCAYARARACTCTFTCAHRCGSCCKCMVNLSCSAHVQPNYTKRARNNSQKKTGTTKISTIPARFCSSRN